MKQCTFKDDRCRACLQAVYGSKDKFCLYHTKLKTGLASRVDSVLTPVELETLFGGRRRDDGRRLDHYTPGK